MAYEVHLEMFEGPLDLLLYLIKKNDLDIYDVSISHITQEYLEYLDLMKELNLEVAGEFLVIASTLMQIKARTLLPSPPEEEETGPDPREELLSKLLEYQKYKEAARFLEAQAEKFKDVYYRNAPHFGPEDKSLDLDLFELLGTLKEILARAEISPKEISREEFPIEEKVQKILFLLEGRPFITLPEIFADERKRLGIITCFLAVLELVKIQKVGVRQAQPFGEVRIYKRESVLAEA